MFVYQANKAITYYGVNVGLPEFFFEKDILNFKNDFERIILFLDFDGTLVPIRDDPASCFLSPEIKGQIKAIAASGKTFVSIMSGRSLSDIKKRIQLQGIYYGGNHGLEISGPGIRYIHLEAAAAKNVIDNIRCIVEKEIGNIKGVLIENKKFTFSLHYRMADKENCAKIRKTFYRIISENTDKQRIAIRKGKKVLELIPNVSWNKGTAALFILHKLQKNCFPIYIGDDLTDETAFEALNKYGLTIRVGRFKKTAARFYLKGQREVPMFLNYINNTIKNRLMMGRY